MFIVINIPGVKRGLDILSICNIHLNKHKSPSEYKPRH
jgi:hypothetical protein